MASARCWCRCRRVLKKVKDTFGVPIITDIHESWQAEQVAQVRLPAGRMAASRWHGRHTPCPHHPCLPNHPLAPAHPSAWRCFASLASTFSSHPGAR